MAAPMTKCGCQQFQIFRRFLLSRSLSVTSRIQQDLTTIQPDDQIVIPKKIKRDSLSVLKALESTVSKDFTASHFRYHDDPFLIPTSITEKRSYSLSKSSGQRAAQYVVEKYPHLFQSDYAEPSIEAYMPPPGLVKSEASEEGLRERIDLRKPAQAFISYQKITEGGGEVSTETLCDLLDLLCMYNGKRDKDPPQALLPDERFFKDTERPNFTNSWDDNGPAEILFSEMREKPARAYCSMIRGRAKHFHAEGACEIYNIMKEQHLPVDLESYNAVIKVSTFVFQDSFQHKWFNIQNILKEIAAAGLSPNLNTFNAVLFSLTRLKKLRESPSWSMQVIQEMKKCNIEPSLASWHYVIQTAYREEGDENNLLHEIMDHLQGKTFSLQAPEDLDFFQSAMSRCQTILQDMELGYKIDKLLNTGDNMKLLGDGFKEGIYYFRFFQLLCTFEQIDTIMEHYSRIVPHAYTPTFFALDDILKAVELNEGFRYLPQLWTDIVLFDYVRKVKYVELILSIMAKKKQDPEMQAVFVKITQEVLDKVEADLNARRVLANPLRLSGSMIGHMVLINLHAGQVDKAWEIFIKYSHKRHRMEKYPSEQSVVELMNVCIQHKHIERAMECLSVMSDCAYPKLEQMADKIKTELQLSEEQINHIDDML